jgi:hypothetical protein
MTAIAANAMATTDRRGNKSEPTACNTSGNNEYPIKQQQLYKSRVPPSPSCPVMLPKMNQIRPEPTMFHPRM